MASKLKLQAKKFPTAELEELRRQTHAQQVREQLLNKLSFKKGKG